MELPGLRLERTGRHACGKLVHVLPTPPGQVFATYMHKERNYRQKAEDIPSKLSESKWQNEDPPLSEQERVTKEVSTGNYSVNRLTLITAAVVLLLAIVQHM